ncbi:MAG: CPBP family intramembrane metalloprotease [Flavobacteriaceae bacterium]|nr:CPBP family intramembrane metalloprotease [Flavobacteriaceae bacterium]
MNFIQQAYLGKTDVWRFLLTFFLTLVGWQIVGIIPISITAIWHAKDYNQFLAAGNDNFMGLGIDANLYLFVMVLMFVIGLAFLLIGITGIHKRSIRSVMTSRTSFDWNRFFWAAALWSILSISFMAVDYFNHPQDFVWNFKLVPFIILVLISVLFIPLQTSFEETLFRGYLMQSLGLAFKNRWMPLILTSTTFGLLHAMNPEVEKMGMQLMVYYIGTGLLFGVITLMDEGLELTLGLHAANNITAAIFVTTNWTVFQTDALFIDYSEPNMGYLVMVPLLIIYPLVLFILARKYKWSDWKEKLMGRIDKPDIM